MWEKGISDGLGRADEDSNKIRADEDRLIKLEEEAIQMEEGLETD